MGERSASALLLYERYLLHERCYVSHLLTRHVIRTRLPCRSPCRHVNCDHRLMSEYIWLGVGRLSPRNHSTLELVNHTSDLPTSGGTDDVLLARWRTPVFADTSTAPWLHGAEYIGVMCCILRLTPYHDDVMVHPQCYIAQRLDSYSGVH